MDQIEDISQQEETPENGKKPASRFRVIVPLVVVVVVLVVIIVSLWFVRGKQDLVVAPGTGSTTEQRIVSFDANDKTHEIAVISYTGKVAISGDVKKGSLKVLLDDSSPAAVSKVKEVVLEFPDREYSNLTEEGEKKTLSRDDLLALLGEENAVQFIIYEKLALAGVDSITVQNAQLLPGEGEERKPLLLVYAR